MSYTLYPTPLKTEERFALAEIVSKGSIVTFDEQPHLMVPVSPMLIDFLKGIRLDHVQNNLAQHSEIDQSLDATPIAQSEGDDGVRLGELIPLFTEDKGGNWHGNTLVKYKRVFQIMTEVLGEHMRVKLITPEHIKEIRQIIIDLPNNYPNRHTKLMTMKNAADLGHHTGMKKRADSTVNYDLCAVMVFFKWACDRWYIDRDPVGNIKIPKNKIKPQFRRFPFSDEQLRCIFNAPLYRGCIDDFKNFKKPGPNHPRRHRFWVPLIALFTGMRLSEILQLSPNDIVRIDEDYFIKISDSNYEQKEVKVVKNPDAHRVIPIHIVLIRIGFIKYYQQMLDSGATRLFPDFGFDENGPLSYRFSCWFNDSFLSSIKSQVDDTSFHSFRHNFRDATREADIPTNAVKELCGWSRSRRGPSDIYGSGLRPKTLKRYMDKIEYPFLDLRHLYD